MWLTHTQYISYLVHLPKMQYILHYYRSHTKLWEGYVFTCVCDSVHGGGVPASVPPGADTPPPRAVHAGRYGQQAGGTHPTGMHCCNMFNTSPRTSQEDSLPPSIVNSSLNFPRTLMKKASLSLSLGMNALLNALPACVYRILLITQKELR